MYWLIVLTEGSSAALAWTVSCRARSALMLAVRIWGLLARARCMASSRVSRSGAFGVWASAPGHKAMVRPTIGKMCGIGRDQYRIRDMNRRLTRPDYFSSLPEWWI